MTRIGTTGTYDIAAIRAQLARGQDRHAAARRAFRWSLEDLRKLRVTSAREDYEALHAAYGRQLWGKGLITIDSPTVFDLAARLADHRWLAEDDAAVPGGGEGDHRPQVPTVYFNVLGVCCI